MFARTLRAAALQRCRTSQVAPTARRAFFRKSSLIGQTATFNEVEEVAFASQIARFCQGGPFPKSLSCPADTLYYLDDPMSQITLAGADKEHPETLERIAQELEKTKYDAVVMQVPSELFPFVEAVPTADAVQSARKEWQAQGIDETGMNLLTSASNSVILQGQAYDTFRAVYNMAKAKGIEVVPGEGSYVESLKAGMEDADNPNDFLVVSTRLNYHLARAYFKNAREIAERQKKSHVLAVAWLSKSPIFLAMWQRHDAMHSPITLDFADEASDSDRESQ